MMNYGKGNPDLTNEKPDIRNIERKARKKGVVKGIISTAVISFIMIITAGIIVYSLVNDVQKKQVASMEDQSHLFTQKLNARDSLINDWVLTFDQIEKDLNLIKEKEKQITVQSSDVEFSKDKKQKILEDIKYINTLLDDNKRKIASLSGQLKSSGVLIKTMQDKIAELEDSMKQRENEISDLKTAIVDKDFEIKQINNRMSDLQVTISQKDETISDQTNVMNKAFLASGTYKNLKKKGLVSKEGGFLGIGKKETLHEDFADSLFTRIDVTEVKTIPVNSKNAKFITEHPSGSYELIRGNDNKIAYIEIKDPDQFWKISRYAVVEFKK